MNATSWRLSSLQQSILIIIQLMKWVLGLVLYSGSVTAASSIDYLPLHHKMISAINCIVSIIFLNFAALNYSYYKKHNIL